MRAFYLLLILSSLAAPATGQDLTLQVGDTPPPLTLDYFDEIAADSARSWKGFAGRVVVLDFWATWCPPCLEAIPHLNELVTTFKSRPVDFISITYEPRRMIEPFLGKHPLMTRIGMDRDFQTFSNYKAWGIPMVVIVGREGRIAAVTHPKYLKASVIRSALAGELPDVPPHKGWPDPQGAETYFRSLVEKAKQEGAHSNTK